MSQFIGEIAYLPFRPSTTNWLPCNGAIYPIIEYSVLYSKIGITWGGDGQHCFAVPNIPPLVTLNGPTIAAYISTAGDYL